MCPEMSLPKHHYIHHCLHLVDSCFQKLYYGQNQVFVIVSGHRGFKLRGRIGCIRCIGVRPDMASEGFRGYAKQLISHVAT